MGDPAQSQARDLMPAAGEAKPAAVAAAPVDLGVMRKAMAWRVKYRKGKGKQRLLLQCLGVHPENRDRMYPSSGSVKRLGLNVNHWAFSLEEADHRGVCVEECPPDVQQPKHWVRYCKYNKDKTLGTMLQQCFPEDGVHQMLFGLLSHNHLLLVLLSFMYHCIWDLDEDEKKVMPTESLSGGLSLEGDPPNWEEARVVMHEGLLMEVLSYKIWSEEPTAPGLIARTLNLGNKAALLETEMQAISVLTHEVSFRLETAVNHQICFLTVQEACRERLDLLVDETDFIELFDFVISLGANKNSYIPELLDFAEKFIDQKQRQLRLYAFAELNRWPMKVPRAKIACLKRAYRSTPIRGFCPAPEAYFAKLDNRIEDLEDLLQHFHVRWHAAVAALGDQVKQATFLGNVDCSAAEAFAKSSPKDVRNRLLEATRKHRNTLVDRDPSLKDFADGWITWKEEKKKGNIETAVAAKIMPKVVIFDEQSGRTNITQESWENNKTKKPLPESENRVQLPWRKWLTSELAEQQVEKSLDHAAITYVLHMLHLRAEHLANAVNVVTRSDGKDIQVQAAEKLDAETLSLLPCVPNALKLYSDSLHPHRVSIIVRKKWRLRGIVKDCDDNWRESTYYVHPEWATPLIKEKEEADDGSTQSCADHFQMEWNGKESMHPFWAVTRVDETNSDRPLKRKKVNCKLVPKEHQVVGVGSYAADSVTATTTVVVPHLTNAEELQVGQELVVEAWKKPEKEKQKKRTWKSQELCAGKKKMKVI